MQCVLYVDRDLILSYSQEYKRAAHQVSQYKTWFIGDHFDLVLQDLSSDIFQNMGLECSESIFVGGIHFRTNNEVGLEVGRKVGIEVLNHIVNKNGLK